MVIKIILEYTIKSSFNNNKYFKFKSKPYKNSITILNKKKPEDIAPNIKYFNPASEPLMEFLFLAIKMKIENVWSSNPRYKIIKLSDKISIIEPMNTRINSELISKVLSSTNSIIIKKDMNTKTKNISFHKLISNKFESQIPLYNKKENITDKITKTWIKLFL